MNIIACVEAIVFDFVAACNISTRRTGTGCADSLFRIESIHVSTHKRWCEQDQKNEIKKKVSRKTVA